MVYRGRRHHRQPDLCARDPDRRARLRAGRRCCASAATCCSGILNGIDTARVGSGQRCAHRAALRRGHARAQGRATRPRCSGACNLEPRAGVPLLGAVCRLTHQKGVDLIAARGRRARRVAGAARRRSARASASSEHALAAVAARHPGPGRRRDRLRRGPRAPDRSRRRPLPDALALRALRAEPDVQPALRHAAGGARDRRTGRHDRGRRDRVSLRARGERGAARGGAARARGLRASRARWREMQRRGMARDFSWSAAARHYADLYARLARLPQR